MGFSLLSVSISLSLSKEWKWNENYEMRVSLSHYSLRLYMIKFELWLADYFITLLISALFLALSVGVVVDVSVGEIQLIVF